VAPVSTAANTPQEALVLSILDSETLRSLASEEPETLLPVQVAAAQNPGQTSGLVKTITCIQVIWFCSQSIARISNSMAISLLELNTFAHCVSAFFIYGFWWHKPYDVTSHTFLQSKMLDFLFLRRTAVEACRQPGHVQGTGVVDLLAYNDLGAEVVLARLHLWDWSFLPEINKASRQIWAFRLWEIHQNTKKATYGKPFLLFAETVSCTLATILAIHKPKFVFHDRHRCWNGLLNIQKPSSERF
jgi:hypothetical protein